MADLNNLSLTGRLTKDAEYKTFASGSKLLEFDLANNTGFGDHAKVNYFKVKCWNKGAESLQPYLKKGKTVAVSGELNLDEYTGRDGNVYKNFVVTCFSITLLGGDKKKEAADDEGMMGDIPF